MFTDTHTSSGAQRRTLGGTSRALAAAALVLAAAAASNHTVTTEAAAGRTPQVAASYNWPVKPFRRAHPVRGNFGDPRTTFKAPATVRGLMTGNGVFAFHFGVDISAPDGTPVYAVRDGVASLRGGRTVRAEHGDGLATEYWHIVPAVRPGQEIEAEKTVLGYVMKGYEHVHFSEFRNGVTVNPLAPGHMGPYRDRTVPSLGGVSFRRGSSEILPELVSGRIRLLVQAYDMPALRVPGVWNGLPVAPARLTWLVKRATDGRVAVARRESFDVRRTIPSNDAFWSVYARGTRQNMSTFQGRRSWRQPGVYVFALTRDPLDTRKLRNGIYRLVVTAEDIRGNESTTTQTFIVRNGRA